MTRTSDRSVPSTYDLIWYLVKCFLVFLVLLGVLALFSLHYAEIVVVLVTMGAMAIVVFGVPLWLFCRFTDEAEAAHKKCNPDWNTRYRHPVSRQEMADPHRCDICKMTRRPDNTCPGCDYQG